jgi:hypothetical protein
MDLLTTKESILSIQDTEIEKIYVKPWKASVYVRTVGSREWDAWEISLTNEKSGKISMQNFRARLAAMCLCDADGKPIFTEKDAKELGNKSKIAMDIIMEAAKRLNGVTAEDEEKLTEDLDETPGDDSDSD